MALKPIYYRLESIARECVDDGPVQSAAAAVRQHILVHGKRLKEGPGRISNEFPPMGADPGAQTAEAAAVPGLTAVAKAAAGSAVDAPPRPPLVSAQMPAAPPPPQAPPPPKTPPSSQAAGGWKRAIVAGSVIGLAAFGGLIATLRMVKQKKAPPANAVAVEVRTTPPGASILVNNEVKCTSDCRLDLAPGAYQVQARLPGYEPAATTVNVAQGAPGAVNLTLLPASQSLKLFTDLDSGKVLIDDQPAGELQDRQLVIDRVQPGKHNVKVLGRMGTAAFTFECSPGSPATLSGPIAANNLLAIILSTSGTRGRLYGSSGPVKVALDGKPVGEAGPNGLDISSPAPGDRELTWGQGKDQRKLQVNFAPTPTLTAFLKADLNAGTLVVLTGEDGVKIYLNGKEYRTTTQRGQIRILVGARDYTIRVAKEGYQDEPEQKVQIAKGEERKVEFKLRPVPKVAALQLRGAAAGAAVFLGRDRLGIVGPDGSFSASNIAPGDHNIELRKEQFLPKRIARSFRAGETVTVEGAEVTLERSLGTLRLALSPADARITIRRTDETQARPAGGVTLQLKEGSYVVSAAAPGYQPKSLTVALASGETKTVELVLAREVAAPVKQVFGGMGEWEEPAAWTSEGPWMVRKGGNYVLYRSLPAAGVFSFNAALLKGRRLQWVVDYHDPKNHALFQVEKKQLIVKDVVNGKQTERAKVNHPMEKSSTYTLQVEIANGSVITRMYDGQRWIVLDSWAAPGRDFPGGKFGFLIPGGDQYGLSGFKFTPK